MLKAAARSQNTVPIPHALTGRNLGKSYVLLGENKLISHFFVVIIIINWSCLPNDRHDRVKNLSDLLNKNQILNEDFSYFVRLVAFVLSSLVLLSWLLLDFLAKLARYSSVSQIPSLVESSWSCLEWLLLLGSPIYSLLTWIPPETCLLLDLLLFLG